MHTSTNYKTVSRDTTCGPVSKTEPCHFFSHPSILQPTTSTTEHLSTPTSPSISFPFTMAETWTVALVTALITLVVVLGIVAIYNAASAYRGRSTCERNNDDPYGEQLADVAPAAKEKNAAPAKKSGDAAVSAPAAGASATSTEGLWIDEASPKSGASGDSGVVYAAHSETVPPAQRATVGVDQPHMKDHPIEQQARQIFEEVKQGQSGTDRKSVV